MRVIHWILALLVYFYMLQCSMFSGVKMGRIPKVDKERALEEARRQEQEKQLHQHMRQLGQQQQQQHPQQPHGQQQRHPSTQTVSPYFLLFWHKYQGAHRIMNCPSYVTVFVRCRLWNNKFDRKNFIFCIRMGSSRFRLIYYVYHHWSFVRKDLTWS